MAKTGGGGPSQATLEALQGALRKVSDLYDADIITYVGPISPPADEELLQLVQALKFRRNVILHLTTPGGLPDTAFRIARCLQRAYSDGKFILFVDSFCKSAGTLIALGADQIIMSLNAELGPLDVQLSKPDALAEQTSGLTPTHAMTTLRKRALESLEDIFLALRFKSGLQITTRTALEIAAEVTKGLFCPIFQQIDPMRLGEISRAMLIAREYGTRLARGNEHLQTLERLISGYPSHGFVIDLEEARDLFRHVQQASDPEIRLSQLLQPYVDEGLKSKEPSVRFISILIQPPQKEIKDESPNRQTAIQKTAGRGGGRNSPPRSKKAGPANGNRRSSKNASAKSPQKPTRRGINARLGSDGELVGSPGL